MKTKKEHLIQTHTETPLSERGNALIYVLVAIVLFAALSFILARQTDSGEAGTLSDERAELYTTQITSYAAQAKSVIDQMLFTGAEIDDLDFIDPSNPNFNAGSQLDRANRVFHPEGGGLILGRLPEEAIGGTLTDPTPGWYIGRFNNVEWTASAAEDVILVAYQIAQPVCEKLNEHANGSSAIPVLSGAITDVLIDDRFFTGSNAEFTTDPSGSPVCAECDEVASLCVSNNAGTAFAFYTVIADQ